MLYEVLVGPKSFVEVAADHNDEALLDGQQMIQAIVQFLRSAHPF
jgi:hypothetical protein